MTRTNSILMAVGVFLILLAILIWTTHTNQPPASTNPPPFNRGFFDQTMANIRGK